ncbi:MAG: dTMP kinase [Elusimicrobiota bacterium]|jgi:dTMP kinase|nr:dTMP kinase [Elusimicrobiota bacterium]
MKTRKQILITFEGGEGSGKTTQSKLLAIYLKQKGFDVLVLREPGGCPITEKIRNILLSPDNFKLTSLSELFLYEASRAQLTAEIILPALEAGKIVICDRFTDATIAYQGWGRKLPTAQIEMLNDLACYNLKPAITFYLDIDPQEGLKRAKGLADKPYGLAGDRIEAQNLTFHKNVRNGYLDLCKQYRQRIKQIAADKNIDEIQKIIQAYTDETLAQIEG